MFLLGIFSKVLTGVLPGELPPELPPGDFSRSSLWAFLQEFLLGISKEFLLGISQGVLSEDSSRNFRWASLKVSLWEYPHLRLLEISQVFLL